MSTFSVYSAWQSLRKSYSLVSIPAPTHFVDSNRGSDSNNGTSSATPWLTLTKARDTAAARAAGACVALANDSVFNLSAPVTWSTSTSTTANGTSDAARWTMTHYDPTGYLPNGRPTITFYSRPVAADWTYVSGNVWYYTMASGYLGIDAYIYFPLADKWGDNWAEDGISVIDRDFRCVTGGTANGLNVNRLYVYSPAGVNPETYYGVGGIEVGNAQNPCLYFVRCGKFATIDGINFERCGYGVGQTNISGTENMSGLVVQRCNVNRSGRLFWGLSDATSIYTVSNSVLECRLTNLGSGGTHFYQKSINCLVAGNYFENINNSQSYRAGVYAQEGSGGASTMANNRCIENYGKLAKYNTGGGTYDGSLLYADPRAQGWLFDRNFGEQMHRMFSINNGLASTISRNVMDDVDTLTTLADGLSINSLAPTIEFNTMTNCGINKYKNGSTAPSNLGIITTLTAAGSSQTIVCRNNNFQVVAGQTVPMLYVLAASTVTVEGNVISTNCTGVLYRVGTGLSNPATNALENVTFDNEDRAVGMAAVGVHTVYKNDASGRQRRNPPQPGALEKLPARTAR